MNMARATSTAVGGRRWFRAALRMLAFAALGGCGSGGDSGSHTPVLSPRLSSVSGTASHGSSLTISGSSFGSKGHAEPAIYDDFDNAAPGNIAGRSVPYHNGIFSGYSTWEEGWNGNLEPPSIVRDAAIPKPSSVYHARASFLSNEYWSRRLQIAGDNFDTGDERYISFYYRFTRTGPGVPGQTKAWIAFPAGSGSDVAYWSTAFGDGNVGCQSGGWRQHLADSPSDGAEQYSSLGGLDLEGEWVRFETYLKQSSNDVANGVWLQTTYRPTLGTREVLSWNNKILRNNKSGGNPWELWEIGGAYYDMCDPGVQTATIDIDELYIDSTPARVEVCDGPTFAGSTRCELQIASLWSDTSITITFNRGYLNTGAAYVYVITPSGGVNATGYAINIL
jgi:hypothetical protein